jgi:prevent-host-death family protein
MSKINRTAAKGAEEARNTLPALLDLAERGEATVISRYGHAVAAIVPIALYEAIQGPRPGQRSLLSLSGSGSGLWRDSGRTIREMRDEWLR